MNTQTNGELMTTHSKLDLIASRVHAARLRYTAKAIRELAIGDTVAANGGTVTRVNNRTLRYEVNGLTVKSFTGKIAVIVDKMLVYLALETEGMQRERADRLQDAMERDVT